MYAFGAKRMTALIAALVCVLGLVVGISVRTAREARADMMVGAGGQYVPLATQGRILDTRSSFGIGGFNTPMPANRWRSVGVTNHLGIPASGVAAVAVTFTALNDTSDGYLKADKDEATPNATVSYLFWSAGQQATGSGVVPVGDDGAIQVMTTSSTDLAIDVQGYYTAGNPSAGGYVPVTQTRLIDTRNGTGLPAAQLAGGSTHTIQVTNRLNGLVPTGSSAVLVNFLIINQAGAGRINPYPADATTRPSTSLNYGSDGQYAMSDAVALSTTGNTQGAFDLYVGAGATDLVVDVLGYFTAADSGGSFTPAKARIFDSRNTGNSPIAPDGIATIPVASALGVADDAIGAVAVNITVFDTAGTSDSWIRAWPSGTPEPIPSFAVMYHAGDQISNMITLPVGVDDGAILLHNIGSDTVDFAIDVEGWYLPPVSPPQIAANYVSLGWVPTAAAATTPATFTITATDTITAAIKYSLDGSSYTSVQSPEADPSISLAAVQATHTLSAIAVDANGNQSTPSTYTFYVGDPPTAPQNVTSTVSGTSALVGWQAPASDNGSAVTSYDVRARDTVTNTTTDVGYCDGCTHEMLTDLVVGDSYTFSVAAQSSAGVGAYGTSSSVQADSAGAQLACPSGDSGCASMSVTNSYDVQSIIFPDGSGVETRLDTGLDTVLPASDGTGGQYKAMMDADPSLNTAGQPSGDPLTADDYLGQPTGVTADGYTTYADGKEDTPNGYHLSLGRRINRFNYESRHLFYSWQVCDFDGSNCQWRDRVKIWWHERIQGGNSHTFYLTYEARRWIGTDDYFLKATTIGCGVNISGGNDYQCNYSGDTSADHQEDNVMLMEYELFGGTYNATFDFGDGDRSHTKFPYTWLQLRYSGKDYWLEGVKYRGWDIKRGVRGYYGWSLNLVSGNGY